MPLGVRIFLVYFLFVGLTGYFVLSTVMDEVRPGVRQSTEETLVDTANLLAEILRQDVKNGTLAQSDLPEMLEDYGKRVPQADIWGLRKEAVNHRIYVTDASGKVLLDSAGVAVGQDYSRWNDVYLTLRGQYGARSSREDPDDPDSSVMYVAAPIKDAGKIIGVVSVAKPNSSLQPYIDRSQRRLAWLGAGLIALGLLVGGLLSWWLSGALRRLTQYAQAVSEGRRAELPRYRGGEMAQLADAVERMRTQLEGKDYVERYVHTLTHELKSPLAAIRGAAELLDGEMPAEQRARFVGNIAGESERLQQLIERLLSLAQVEQRQGLEEVGKVDLREIAASLLEGQAARIQRQRLRVENRLEGPCEVRGEQFLLRQALANLLDNALDFTPARRHPSPARRGRRRGYRPAPVQPGAGDSRLRPGAPHRTLLLAAAPGQRAQEHRAGTELRRRGGATAWRPVAGRQSRRRRRGAALAAARLRRLHGNSIDSPHGDPKPAIAAPQTFRHHPDGESPMNRTLAYKLGAIALLILLLLIPLLMIDGLIRDRQEVRDGVLQDIARSSSYSQRLTGPLLVVPYRRTVREWVTEEKTEKRVLQEREQRGELYFLPDRFALDGQMRTELRYRGIYQARLYHVDNKVAGYFQVPAHYGIEEDLEDYQFETPFLAMGISDIRGIENALRLSLNGASVDFEPGSRVGLLGSGVHAPLQGVDGRQAQRLEYAFDLSLLGSERLDIVPVGRDSQVILKADWPHPSFGGEFLPSEREITAQGFTARWQTSFFATNMEEALRSCVEEQRCDGFQARAFGVGLVDPVDQYLKADRAIKYALLFITLTFAGFFLFEVLKRLAVHPIQYALVGLALAFFYLLLLSLAEHVGFELAYLVSAGACVGLIGFYLCFVLRSVARGLGFSVGLAGLYGLLYGLLSAEDYALLMGSLLLFAVLAAVMVLTRRLDWYGVGRKDLPAVPARA